MKLVVYVRLRRYDDDRYVLALSYGEDKASVRQVDELSDEVASHACYFLRKCYLHEEGEKYQFFDWRERLFSNSAIHRENTKMLSEIRGTGLNNFIYDMISLNIGIENEDFSQSDVKLIVVGSAMKWIIAWHDTKSRITK